MLLNDLHCQIRLLIRIHDCKFFRPSGFFYRETVFQHPQCDTVECPEALYLIRRDVRFYLPQTFHDLIRCLVCESQHSHLFKRYVPVQMQVQDLSDEHCRLPAAHIGVHHTCRTLV